MINSYDAGGHKLTTQYYTPIGTVIVTQGSIHGSYTTANSVLRLDDYCGCYLYENGTSASVHPLTKILTPEGYIDMSTSGYPYCYYKQDHLGSNREVTSYSGTTGTVVQRTEYYPSGTAYVEGTGVGVQPFKFTGKELILKHGLNWQDFGARWLDNVRMQWTTMDPLAEKYYSISPYAYVRNNPILLIDPDGKTDWGAVLEGTVNTISGGVMMSVGAGMYFTGVGAPLGAFLIISGMGVATFGAGEAACGLVSNNSKQSKIELQNAPKSIIDVGGIVTSKATGDKSIRTKVSIVEFGVTTALSLPKTLLQVTVAGAQGTITTINAIKDFTSKTDQKNRERVRAIKANEKNKDVNKDAQKQSTAPTE